MPRRFRQSKAGPRVGAMFRSHVRVPCVGAMCGCNVLVLSARPAIRLRERPLTPENLAPLTPAKAGVQGAGLDPLQR